MRNIIIVDCISTGTNYIGDIVNRSYNPIVLEMKPASSDVEGYQAMVNSHYDRINEKFDMIYERDTYEETLEVVRKLDPKLVLPGNEHGVVLATRLSNDLGLLCNSLENLDAMTLKDEMHKRLAQHGLRYIRGRKVKSIEEAVEFYDDASLSEVVIKPVYSAGSAGVRICLNKQEMIDSIEEVFDKKNYYGENINELLVQERINGEEYIVNTVSCKGFHRTTSIWKYNKIRTSDGAIIYDSGVTIDNLDIGEAEMVEYAYQVADAIGIEYGPVHGEYMIDDKGPVLIEVNCRPCGGNMESPFLDRIFGQHETDSILDAYLKPNRFFEKAKQRYRLLGHGALKFVIVPEDMLAKSSSMDNISPKLRSFYSSSFGELVDEGMFYVKTEDLNSAYGIVYLVNEDKSILYEDLSFLRSVEKNAFSLVLSSESNKFNEIDEEELTESLEKVVDITVEHGTGLLITDQFLENPDIVQIGLNDIDTVNQEFDYIIVNLNKSLIEKRGDIAVNVILNIFSRIRYGGIIFVPETTYKYISGGRKGVEALLKNLDLRIEVPPYGFNAGVIASKKILH